MQVRKRSSVLVAALLACVALAPQLSWPCSEGVTEPIWSFTKHPDFPLQPFARGELGIVQPSFAPSYLVAAYLHLSGRTLKPAEQESLLALWSTRLGARNARGTEARESWDPNKGVKDWQEARKEVVATQASSQIDRYRTTAGYSTYLNCADDAFITATATLRERARTFGATSPRTRSWVEAQDQVFANCSAKTTRVIPPVAVQGDTLAKADRAYQVATAHFYAGDFEEAAWLFRLVAADVTSPWQKWGQYLAARAILRQATISSNPPSKERLTLAQAELDGLLKTAAPAEVRRAARNLRDRILYTLSPLDQAHALSARILKAGGDDPLEHLIGDYTFALEQAWLQNPLIDWSNESVDDLTRWVMTFHVGESAPETDARLTTALARWRATRSLPWLVAVMSRIPADHPEADSALSASRAAAFTAPGGATLTYHRLRLMIAKGQRTKARAILDDLLKRHAGSVGPSAKNKFLDQRLQVALDLSDLNAHLPRRLVAWGFELAGELPEAGLDLGDPVATSPLGAELVNGLPLSEIRRLALELNGAETVQREVARVAWVRALVLDDEDTLAAIEKRFPGIRSLGPQPSPARTPLLRLMKTPHPPWVLPHGFWDSNWGPDASPYGSGWWCGAGYESQPTHARTPAFLDPRDAKRAQDEWAKIVAAGSGAEFFVRSAIRWARATPGDPEVPEALHLAVATTRWACPSDGLGDASRQAFRLLHEQYGRSAWAKKTKYWYAGRW